MKLQLSRPDQLASIMQIIAEAQELLASLGIDQWQDGYPQERVIQQDIDNEESYVVTEGESLLGTTMLTFGGEETYEQIEGEWITQKDTPYGVIHRMAVGEASRGKGVARFTLYACEQKVVDQGFKSMRIDTHEDNLGMQSLLRSSGYHYCGVIFLRSGSKRLAFEKILKVTDRPDKSN
jgi:GNAT superfamily N-acetyltransferase